MPNFHPNVRSPYEAKGSCAKDGLKLPDDWPEEGGEFEVRSGRAGAGGLTASRAPDPGACSWRAGGMLVMCPNT
jgi:hypothetical protein